MTDASKSKKECHRCGRRFARLEHLQRHERSHTKEKPFACLSCSKAFTRKDLLTRHNRIYHSQQATRTTREHDNFQVDVENADQTSYPVTEPSANVTRNGPFLTQDCHSSGFILPHDTSASFLDQSVTYTGYETLQTAPTLNQAGIWTPDFGYTGFATSHEGDEFSNFVDRIALPSNCFSPSYQPVPDWPSESPFSTQVAIPEPERICHSQTDAEADSLVEGVTPWASRMPSVQPQELQGNLSKGPKRAIPRVLTQVTHQCRENMVQELKLYSSLVPAGFVLPSRHTLTCFITGYVTVFNEHYPLLHLPTLELESLSLELFLSIAALGAQYYWERAKGFELFHVARTVTYDRLRGQASQNEPSQMEQGDVLQLAQALILLIAVSTWSEAGKGEAFSLRSLLEEVLQADALDVKTTTKNSSWLDWKRYEEVKRTKLIAYAFFNLHTITFDVPPMILYRDIDVNLASSEKTWRAENVDTWHQLREKEPSEISFSSVFHALFQSTNDEREQLPSVSPLSGHILMHAIIQHMWLLQQAGNLPIRQSIASTSAAASVELALKRWRQCSELDHEQTSDHSLPDGPIPFTSRALLRLAYIRLNIESGSARSIASWNPIKIAKSLCQHPAVQRSDQMTKAALHCAQGLGIPVKLGINFVAHTQVFYWSNQYALCSLECALLLTKWLKAVTASDLNPKLSDQENKLLDFVVQLVNHTEYEASREKLLQNNKYLSTIILRLWAKLFRAEAVWQIVDLIGKSLEAYADLLEQDMNHDSRRTESIG